MSLACRYWAGDDETVWQTIRGRFRDNTLSGPCIFMLRFFFSLQQVYATAWLYAQRWTG